MGGYDELAQLDATAQAELVRGRQVTPAELVDAAIARADRINPSINAIVTPMYELAQAAAADVRRDAPFAGVPFLLKDLMAEYAGTPMTEGSGYLAGHYVSSSDSELVTRLKRAGLLTIGKTNTPEFGLVPTTEPVLFGSCRNPWDLRRSTGGSSGGSAAAVAAGIAPMAHANDGGGSIRVPAAACGLFGMKPTRGRNPLGPHYGDVAGGLVAEHAVTRSVRDSAALLDATSGPAPGDPYNAPSPERPFLDAVGRAPDRLRIAMTTVPLSGSDVHPDCVAATTAAARLCEDLGHHVEEAAPVVDADRLLRCFGAVWIGFLGWAVRDWQRRIGREPEPAHFEPATWRAFERSREQTAADYLLAFQDLQAMSRDVAAFFEDYDILLTPTMAQPPVPLGYFDYAPETRRQHIARLGEYTGFTLICNVTGQPAMSVPLHWSDAGLPIGVQFIGRYGDEASLFALAGQLEQARPWADRWPSLN